MGNSQGKRGEEVALRKSGLTATEEAELKRAFKHGRRNDGEKLKQWRDSKASLGPEGFRAAISKLARSSNKHGIFGTLGKLEGQHSDVLDVVSETLFQCFDCKNNGEIDWYELSKGLSVFMRGTMEEQVHFAFKRMKNRCTRKRGSSVDMITRGDIEAVVRRSVRLQRNHQRFLETKALNTAVKLCENLGRKLGDARLSELRNATASHVERILKNLEASIDEQVERSMRILDCDGDGEVSLDDFKYAAQRNPELLKMLDPLSVYDILEQATSGDPKIVAGVVSTCEAASQIFSKHEPRHRGSLVKSDDFAKLLASGWDGDVHIQEDMGNLESLRDPNARERVRRRSVAMVAVGESKAKPAHRKTASSINHHQEGTSNMTAAKPGHKHSTI